MNINTPFHEEMAQTLSQSPYRSQWQQDEYIHKTFFPNATSGFFVDVGAHNGVTGSNSYFFEKELHWQGICIEPMLDQFVKLVENRNCYCLNCCVYDRTGFVLFMENIGYTEMLSGITEAYNAPHLQRIQFEQMIHGGHFVEKRKPAYTLSKILDLHDVKVVDYLSIDTEGSEYQILSSLDFNRFRVNIISVENNYPHEFARVHDHLIKNRMFHHGRIIGDEIYVHRDFVKEELKVPPNSLSGN